MTRTARLISSSVVLAWGLRAGHAQDPAAIARLPVTTRAEILARAKTFATHTWTCGSSNLNASCYHSYRSDWHAGQVITGVPYNWGGFDSPESFDKKVQQGWATGSHSRYGVLSCTAGTDCSGFVSYCWGIPLKAHIYTTRNLRDIGGRLRSNWITDLKPGDALVKPGSHVILFTGYNRDGTFNICEAAGGPARVVCHKTTWALHKGYFPLQYKGLDE